MKQPPSVASLMICRRTRCARSLRSCCWSCVIECPVKYLSNDPGLVRCDRLKLTEMVPVPIDTSVFCIERMDLGFALEQIEDIIQPERWVQRIEFLVNPADECIVLGVVDGPAMRHRIIPW